MTRRPIMLAAIVAMMVFCQSGMGASADAQGPAPTDPAHGDPVKGEALFGGNCGTCHTTDKTSPDSTTLSLFGVVGRKAGSVADFSYSPAMQSAGIVWTPAKLNAYLENPAAVVPNNIMYVPGLPDPTERAALIAYLATLK